MLQLVLIFPLLVQYIFGIPSSIPSREVKPTVQHNEPRTYFSKFEIEDLNPFNWVVNNRQIPLRNETDIKFENIYKILKCLTGNETDKCNTLIESAKKYFEPTILKQKESENRKSEDHEKEKGTEKIKETENNKSVNANSTQTS